MKTLTLDQYPKHRGINPELLSTDQINIRVIATTITNVETKVCKKCLNTLPITEFWFNNKTKNYRKSKCKDCMSEEQGVIEIGRVRFARKILTKGFRRCSICKDIKHISEFSKDKHSKNTKDNKTSHTCKDCNYKLHRHYLDNVHNKRVEAMPIKHTVDNKDFKSDRSFAIYLLKTYEIPITQTEKRIQTYKYTDEQCTLPSHKIRHKP
jgi:hypothetical protein